MERDVPHSGSEGGSPTVRTEQLNSLLPLVIDELRFMAKRHMRRESDGHTLETSALLNEAYLKLRRDRSDLDIDPAEFRTYASRAMREVLLDYARHKKAAKRGGEMNRVSVEFQSYLADELAAPIESIEELHVSLERLEEVSPAQAEVVEHHVFGCLTFAEIAELSKRDLKDVQRDWTVAKAWLKRDLKSRGCS
ncbi:MAG: RNA polymerase sigma-70 factor (ECF subfamily) [Planctomycetota bacterium]|jgi:RNA polymerase sigma-70 factor (ECF subfamily)